MAGLTILGILALTLVIGAILAVLLNAEKAAVLLPIVVPLVSLIVAALATLAGNKPSDPNHK